MKKVLFAACAVFAITGLQARSITIDNDMDGRQATEISVVIYFSNNAIEKFNVRAGKEHRVRFPKSAHAVKVLVRGMKGAGIGHVAYYRIPQDLIEKKIKIDADFKNGRIQLSHDRR